jgi:hypothetical protein
MEEFDRWNQIELRVIRTVAAIIFILVVLRLMWELS